MCLAVITIAYFKSSLFLDQSMFHNILCLPESLRGRHRLVPPRAVKVYGRSWAPSHLLFTRLPLGSLWLFPQKRQCVVHCREPRAMKSLPTGEPHVKSEGSEIFIWPIDGRRDFHLFLYLSAMLDTSPSGVLLFVFCLPWQRPLLVTQQEDSSPLCSIPAFAQAWPVWSSHWQWSDTDYLPCLPLFAIHFSH